MKLNPLIVAGVNGVELDENGYRIIKVIRMGDKDVQTGDQVTPAGVDSCPHPEENAIFADTLAMEQSLILGYMIEDQITEPGEIRIYSTDAKGKTLTQVYVRKDATIELGMNPDDWAVKYSKLEQSFNELQGKVNALVTAFNTHTHIVDIGNITALPVAAPAQSSTADITQAKAANIKIGS